MTYLQGTFTITTWFLTRGKQHIYSEAYHSAGPCLPEGTRVNRLAPKSHWHRVSPNPVNILGFHFPSNEWILKVRYIYSRVNRGRRDQSRGNPHEPILCSRKGNKRYVSSLWLSPARHNLNSPTISKQRVSIYLQCLSWVSMEWFDLNVLLGLIWDVLQLESKGTVMCYSSWMCVF